MTDVEPTGGFDHLLSVRPFLELSRQEGVFTIGYLPMSAE